MREALVEAIENLPEREQYVMSMYYEHDMNLKEIAAVLKVTEVARLPAAQPVDRLRMRCAKCEQHRAVTIRNVAVLLTEAGRGGGAAGYDCRERPAPDARALIDRHQPREASALGRDAAEVRGAIDDTIKAAGAQAQKCRRWRAS